MGNVEETKYFCARVSIRACPAHLVSYIGLMGSRLKANNTALLDVRARWWVIKLNHLVPKHL